jgi:NADH dehydrogenase
MEVLVTGATGFVGRELVRQLHAAGHRIRLLVRRPDAPPARGLRERLPVQLFRGDVLEPSSFSAAFAGAEAVIHLVGIISEVGRNTFENAHAVATQNVVAAAKAARVGRYVQMSALGTRPDAVSRYHQTKWAAEEAVRGSGLAWTILRPSLIYGAEDHLVSLFARLSRWSPVLPVMGSGRGRLQPVAVEAVAHSFVRALEEPRSVGQTLDLCGPDRLTFVEMLRAILEVLGRRRLLLRVPMPVARAQARALEWVFPRLLGRAAPLNRDQLLMLEEDNVGDPTPAAELFGLRLEPFHEGIRRFLERT